MKGATKRSVIALHTSEPGPASRVGCLVGVELVCSDEYARVTLKHENGEIIPLNGAGQFDIENMAPGLLQVVEIESRSPVSIYSWSK